MKHKHCYFYAITLLVTIIEIVAISITDSRFLLNYLIFSPLAVFQKNYPRFSWSIFLVVKLHLPVLLLLSTIIIFKGRSVILSILKNIFVAFYLIVSQVLEVIANIDFPFKKIVATLMGPIAGDKVIIPLVMVLAFGLRIVYMLHTDNYFNGDTGARLYYSYLWCLKPQIFMGYDWLPFHFYLVGLAIKVTGDVLWAPRLVEVLMGTLSIVPFYFLVKKIADKQLAVISALFLAVFPFHIKMSVVTLTEVPFTFLIICALFFQMKALSQYKNRSNYLRLCALFISCAGFMRMEAWLYAFLIGVVFIVQVPFRQVLVYGYAAAFTPIFILLATWLAAGDAFRSINYSDYEVKLWAIENHMTTFKNIKQIPEAFLSFSFILIPIGVFTSALSRRLVTYLFVVLIPFFLILYKIATVTLTGQSRYLFTTSVLLIPFFFAGIRYLVSKIVTNKFTQSTVVINIGLLCMWSNFVTHLYEPIVFTDSGLFSKGFIESALWAKKNLPTGSRLFLGNSNFCSNAWMVYSGSALRADLPNEYPWQKLSNKEQEYYPKYIVDNYITGRTWVGEHYKNEGLLQTLEGKKITHIVIFKGGILEKHLAFDSSAEDWKGYHFKKIADFSGNRIYSVDYSESDSTYSK